MKKTRSTKRALLMSGLALFACISMLVGSTFAWFTDKVESGRNVIAAGNLDVELYAGDVKVGENTKLFDEDILWEPGMVVYENLQVRNVGTLALKYQLSVNALEENNLNGHKLSEVVKVAIIDAVADGTDRATVLAAAKASDKIGDLSNLYLTGDLEAGAVSAEQAVVIFWEPTENDNDYNANNGQKTSDGKPLFIEFGIVLEATQKMHENDSFGNDYDKLASLTPKANAITEPAQPINATLNDWGGSATADVYNAPFVLQFEPNETLEQCMNGAYKFYNVDFVVKADKDVPANSMALAGFYHAFCDDYNGGNWVALSANETITAGTSIRLVETMGQGAIKVSYKDICQYANDGTGFLCTAIDLTGENAGTTLTVELRMYKTTSDPNGSSHDGDEVVPEKSYVIGTYTYTFANKVSTAEDLKAQLAAGNDVTLAADIVLDKNDTITIPAGVDATIDLAGHKISSTADKSGNQEMFLVKGNLTVKNGTMDYVAYNNQGWNAMITIFDITAGGVLSLDNVTASVDGSDMNFIAHLNNWGSATLTVKDCDFTASYVAIRAFNSGYDMNTIVVEDTDFHNGRVFWLHNYTAEGKDASTLDVTFSGVTSDNAKPVRLGFSNAVYYDLNGNIIP